jgi:catechol 2,3-dioxygenase-like lactoylglutathione lyase family enzyme
MRAPSVRSMLNALTITQIYVPDQDQALDFYVGKLGFEVTNDMEFGPMRWLTVALPGQRDRQILLEKPGPPSMSEETASQVRDLITKGAAGGHLFFQCDDAYKTHAELKAAGVEISEEPVDQPYGIDFGLRDPFGNHLRIAQMKQA